MAALFLELSWKPAVCVPILGISRIRTETFGILKKGYKVLGAILLEEVFDFLGRIGFIFA